MVTSAEFQDDRFTQVVSEVNREGVRLVSRAGDQNARHRQGQRDEPTDHDPVPAAHPRFGLQQVPAHSFRLTCYDHGVQCVWIGALAGSQLWSPM